MSDLSDLWAMVTPGYINTSGVIALAAQHDTLATGQGYPRPPNVRDPRSWDAPRATSDDVTAWESWYNGVAARGGLPPTTALSQTAATGTPWATLLNTAQTRTAPAPVVAYLTTAGDAWTRMRGSVQPALLASQITAAVTQAETNIQAWWFRALGGATGAALSFTRGDGTPVANGSQMTPIGGPTSPVTVTAGNNDTAEMALKAIGLYLGFRLLTRGRRGRR